MNLTTGEIEGVVKFENGAMIFIDGGNNVGRCGTLMSVEQHPGSYQIVHVKDALGHSFATRMSNCFVIGQGKKSLVTLPRGDGTKQSLVEERNARLKRYAATAAAGGEESDE